METMETLMRTCRVTSRTMELLLLSWECFWGIAASIFAIVLLSAGSLTRNREQINGPGFAGLEVRRRSSVSAGRLSQRYS